jgi:hypothetical protein
MLDAETWDAVNFFVVHYLNVQAEDTVLIVYAPDSREPAAWISAALSARNISARLVWMLPLNDEDFFERLTSILPSPTELLGRLLVLTLERDTMSHDDEIQRALSRYAEQQFRITRMTNASSDIFLHSLSVLPEEISARNTTILNHCMPASRLRICTAGGTDLKVSIDTSRYRWISNRGIDRPGGMVILPPGEVATFPAFIEGVLVADFAINLNTVTGMDVRLHNHPITVWIENGKAVNYKCDDLEISCFLDKCFQEDCHAYNVGELGFGTNFGIDSAVPWNSHINERRPGVHVGFGQHNQPETAVSYFCKIHLDLIAQGGSIWIDDEPVPLDLENIHPSLDPHPLSHHNWDISEQDIFEPKGRSLEDQDCCGVLHTKLGLVM